MSRGRRTHDHEIIKNRDFDREVFCRLETELFHVKGYEVCTHNGKTTHKLDPVALAIALQDAGAGEIVINSIDRDGEMKGYDFELAQQVRTSLRVPMTVLGGAGSLDDIGALIRSCGVVGAAVGSLFVFKGKFPAVLINYPTSAQKDEIFRATLV